VKVDENGNPDSYQRAILPEGLDAEHAIGDACQAFYTALNEQAKSTVALEQSTGIWGIEFQRILR
jgi:hypothetical protein